MSGLANIPQSKQKRMPPYYDKGGIVLCAMGAENNYPGGDSL